MADGIDFAALLEPVAEALWGKPTSKRGTDLRYGNHGARSVNTRRGVWTDHSGEHGSINSGGTLALIERETGLTGKDAIEWLEKRGLVQADQVADRRPEAKRRAGSAPTPSTPPPEDIPPPESNPQDDPASTPPFDPDPAPSSAAPQQASLTTPRQIVATYDYTDFGGSLIYQVQRWEWLEGGKRKKNFSQRRPYEAEPNVWINGLTAGDYMRRGPGDDWSRYDEERAVKYGMRERTTFGGTAHGLYRCIELREAILAGEVVFLCYSPDTEVLTPNGWMRFDQFSVAAKETKVASWDMKSGRIQFEEPIARQVFKYSGEMVSIRSVNVDHLVTPDHRQPICSKSRSGEWVKAVRPASQVNIHNRLPVSGFLDGGSQRDEASTRLLASWVCDGSSPKIGTQVLWNLKKERKKQRLRQLLSDCGVAFREKEFTSTPGWTCFFAQRDAVARAVGGCLDKTLSWSVLDWDLATREAFLDELKHWDGDKTTGSSRFFTSVKQNAEIVSAMCVVSGRWSNVREDARRGSRNYVVNYSEKAWKQISKKPSRVTYEGEVFCCTVSTGFLVVRRNGYVGISGNCEGEKKVEALARLGITASSNSGGAANWSTDHAEVFRNADVVVAIDNDEPGRKRGQEVSASLYGIARRVRILDFAAFDPRCPAKYDVADWIEAGGDAETLFGLIARCPDWEPPKFRSRFNAVTWADLDAPGPEHEWLIKGVLTRAERSMMAGASQSGKSFLAIDMAMSIARGIDYFGRKVLRGGVVYQAGEGGRGVKKRLRAYRRYHGVDHAENLPFVLLPSPVDLYASEDMTEALIAEIRHWASTFPIPLELVVIDTLSAATPGADENSSKDVGPVLARCERIATALNCHVMIVHHMNAEGSKPRGHTSIFANLDNVITVSKIEGQHDHSNPNGRGRQIREAKVTKQKDGEDGQSWRFTLPSVELGLDADGEPITSCVVASPVNSALEGVDTSTEENGLRLTSQGEVMLRAIYSAIEAHGEVPPPELRLPFHVKVVRWSKVKEAFTELSFEEGDDAKKADAVRKALQRWGETLYAKQIIGRAAPYIWLTGRRVKGFKVPEVAERQPKREVPPVIPPDAPPMSDDDLNAILRH